jgi:hypothetical protein
MRILFSNFGWENSTQIKSDFFVQKNNVFYDPEQMKIASPQSDGLNSVVTFQNEYNENMPNGVSNLDESVVIFKSKDEAVKHVEDVYNPKIKKAMSAIDKKFKGMV